MKRLILLAGLAVFSSTLFAQMLRVDWSPSPVLHTVSKDFAGESAVIITDMRQHQYIKDEKNGIIMLIANRRLIKVIDDKGIEMYNKIYIPFNSNLDLEEIKARTIRPDGKVIDLTSAKILDVEEEGKMYKKFALEGVEKGSEIEYYYRFRKNAYFFGLEIFQSNLTPCMEAVFQISYPRHLAFTVKGYNGFEPNKDTVTDGQKITTLIARDFPALNDEKYSARAPYGRNVQYKLSYNLSNDKNVRLFTWNELAKNVFNNYTAIPEKEIKAAEGLIKKMDIPASATEEEKIRLLEDYLKTNINAEKEVIGEDGEKLDKIIKNKLASFDGLNKLFIACMDKLGINWQIVFPSKRDELPLDESLENYRLVDELLFYFPSTGKFIEPSNAAYRYPYVQPYWAATKGLFLKGTTIGNFKTALASFEDIPIEPYESSAHNMEASLKFNEALDSLVIHSKQILLGYGAAIYRAAYSFTPKDKLDELSKDIIKAVAKSENIRNIRVENTQMTDCFANKPLNIEADITSAELLEVAGKKILLKIGEVIGPQEQMYQEKPRQLPLLIQYPHALDRVIRLTIPDGYQVKNLADLAMNITDKKSGKETMGFVSTYEMNGNELKITLHEFYKETGYPVSRLEDFKNVINASADFNKVTLVLEKK